MKKLTLIVATLFVTMFANAQTVATFEDGNTDALAVDMGGWHIATLFAQEPSVYNNPDKTGINTSDKCAGATNVADADWWGNFLSLKFANKVTITDQNRFLTFMAYRSIQPKNMRLGFNNNDGHELWLGKLDADATWQKITVDLGAEHMGQDLETLIFVLSCNWDEPKSGWGQGSYYFDNFVMSSADAILDEDVSFTNPESPTTAPIVELKRAFTKDSWNTLCLPISLSEVQIAKIFGDSTKVAHFTGFDGANITFSTARKSINANEPVLIMPANTDINCYFVNDVSISPVTLPSNTMSVTKDGETLSFVGNYSPIENLSTMCPVGGSVYYSEGTNVYKLDASSSIALKAFHAYFKGTGSEKTAILVDGGATSIKDAETSENASVCGPVYDINGRLVSKNASAASLNKGLYIMNGKKIVVK
jgi:hypothetical protein